MGHLAANSLRRALLVVAITVGFVGAGPGHSQERPIRFGIPEEGYPPYLMSEDGYLFGIVGDTFVAIANAIGYRTEVVILPEKRLRRDMKRGAIDAVAAALEWESDTTGYVWTDGIIRVSDNVVMAADRKTDIATLDELRGKTVVLRLGYTYPSLDEMIESGEIDSVRTNRFENLLKMVGYRRVDYGVVDRNVANWVMRERNLKFDPPLYFATPGFDEVEYRIVLISQKWAPFVDEFNEALAKLKMSGGLQEILDSYR
jgi:polar amino acid transport system substrate-binding protein